MLRLACASLKPHIQRRKPRFGEVLEWLNRPVSKTGVRVTVPRVRIPPSPPLAPAKAFSRSSSGRIFPLFSGVMREGLLTGPRPEGLTRVLSGPIFSGPVNRRVSGEQPQVSAFARSFELCDSRDLENPSGWRTEQRSNAARCTPVRLQLATNLVITSVRALC